MIMYILTRLLSLLTLLQLSRCHFSEDELPYSTVVGIIRYEVQSSMVLTTGALIRNDLVITSSRAVVGYSPNDFIVVSYCIMLTSDKNMNEINSVCTRQVSKIIYAVDPDYENNPKNSLAVLKLKMPFYSNYASINTLINNIDDVDKNNCVYIAYKKSRNPWEIINRNVYWYDEPFNLESFTRQSSKDVITALTESSFDPIEDKESVSLYDLIKGKSKEKYLRYYEGPDSYGFFDNSPQYYGAPVFCRLKTHSSPYVQVGVTHNYIQAFTPNKNIEVVYFINVIGRLNELMKKIDEI